MRKTVLRNRGKRFSKQELQKAIEMIFREEDSISNLGESSPWFRIASNLGYSTKRPALYTLKKWCTRNNLNFKTKLTDKVEETYTHLLLNDDNVSTLQEGDNMIKQKQMKNLNKELDMTKPEFYDYNMETETSDEDTVSDMIKPEVVSGLDNKQKEHQPITVNVQENNSNVLEHLSQDKNDDQQKTSLKNSDLGYRKKVLRKPHELKSQPKPDCVPHNTEKSDHSVAGELIIDGKHLLKDALQDQEPHSSF
ncbi:unnamed protein product [Mytilus coruscus]|uniref:Uncharacterized protein n=1 Tax=Mytilus coruscus TaxID=42192 RepID=A0A6J8ACF7_MYTCO|nr:unnamed protein product [Mytilus coruscus]